MRRLLAVEFVTVDGVMQGLGSPDEDRDGGFEYGGWGTAYADVLDEVLDPGTLGSAAGYLLGRRTYDALAAFWPAQPPDNPMAASLNRAAKYVVTRTRTSLDWSGAEVVSGDLPAEIGRLKSAGDGTLTMLGSGMLLQEVIRLGLLDDLQLFVHPLLLGAGKRLFGELVEPRRLELTKAGTTSKGTVALSYRLGA